MSVALNQKLENTFELLKYTNGRDKLYRTVQYAARLLAWFYARYGIPQGTFAGVSLDAIKQVLSTSRKLMRLGKPMETLKAAIKAFSNQSNDIVVKSLSITRHLNYTLFLSFDALLWLHLTKIRPVSKATSEKFTKNAYRFWALGLLSGVITGIYKEQMLSRTLVKARRQALSDEKEGDANVEKVITERVASRKALAEDGLNLLIPFKGLDMFNLSEGVVSAAGLITSVMGLESQWLLATK